MGKAVTAEGVETEHQVEILTQLGCDSLQGWYFAKACNLLHLPFMMASLKSYARDRMQRHAAAS
jgi:EAL domain-containing protein (putative c-di-GMP-specific phosphodiesterase class I)